MRPGKLYQHEMTLAQHEVMLDAPQVHPGPVILSSYDHPLYRERLHQWECVQSPAVSEHSNQRIECLWLNRHCPTLQQLRLFE